MNIDIKSAENKLINVFSNIDDVCFLAPTATMSF